MYNIGTKIENGCAPCGLQDLYLWQAVVNLVNERIQCRPDDQANFFLKPDPVPFPQKGADIQNTLLCTFAPCK